MNVSELLSSIDSEISRLQQVRALLSGHDGSPNVRGAKRRCTGAHCGRTTEALGRLERDKECRVIPTYRQGSRGPLAESIIFRRPVRPGRRVWPSPCGDPIYGEIFWRVAHARQANAIPNAQLQANVAKTMERASRGVSKAHSLAEQIAPLETSLPRAAAIDCALLTVFAVQHSVMARRWFKERWTQVVPWAILSARHSCCAPAWRFFCCSGGGVPLESRFGPWRTPLSAWCFGPYSLPAG